jgi:hypothetical protein
VVTLSGGQKWRAFWAVQFGDSGEWVNLASLFSGFLLKGKQEFTSRKEKSKAIEKKVNMHLYSVDL